MASLKLIVEKLKGKQHRDSTSRSYLAAWRRFNAFIIRLDVRPPSWEERLTFVCSPPD